jgi:hypothetical protein
LKLDAHCLRLAGIAVLLAACEADPRYLVPDPRPPVETGFVGGASLRLVRDDYRPTGWYHDAEDLVRRSGGAELRLGDRTWPADLEWRWTSGNHGSYAFFLDPEALPLSLDPGAASAVDLVLRRGPHGQPERVVARTVVTLDPAVLVVPVVTWNVGGTRLDLGPEHAQYLLDRAEDTRLPDWIAGNSWARQAVDDVWSACRIQFRLVAHHDATLPGDCWRSLVISNQSSMIQRCSTLRPACTAGDPAVQDFTDCAQQEQNRCSLLDLVRVAAEDPGYTGPPVFQPDAVNVYFAEQFHLQEDLTMGIGCAGAYPLIALSDQWPDASRKRLAHELGHVMGISEHLAGTIMGDEDDRTGEVTVGICDRTRAFLRSRYGFVR